ncbi:sigma 54-interacting transcriptional regulator [Anaerosalibacter massiliensis]|uniref:Sigma 54-interacting transcriptional regulator n=1 Tax=Anaerosalibacter massiliensis TaxID=1347392 RepID=A0A9X2MJL5_9FIRM|nr:sigma 54-interacting transcriptional regulator [Anaerosalibacter massiliensis]
MTRKEKIFMALKSLSEDMTLNDLKEENTGFTTTTISNITGIGRSNVSRELNILVKEGKAIKIIGRPVRFIDRKKLEEMTELDLHRQNIFHSLAELFEKSKEKKNISKDIFQDPFEKIIGSKGSLELPIKQAKAAILYPPKGLHTLITGDTGVGKSTFAQMMYRYAIFSKIIDEKSEFIVFNCSEYAENPQLILSQLFGHAKGAFTGADRDKQGLIEKADGGIILLDEIHRLPPEGQEMLFLLMDKKIYRKLGETETYREADILIIGATTEDINSTLLKTFLRRIPMIIRLPSLSERGLSERLELIENFFKEEVNNVDVPINVYRDVLRALLLYDCQGNIGQLKGDIQLLCARGFLDYKTYNKKQIDVETPFLSEHIYSGLLNYNKNREDILNLLKYEKDYYTFNKTNGEKFIIIDNYSLSTDLYEEIIEKHNNYRKEGYSEGKINEIINDDIEKYFKELLIKCNAEKEIPEKEELFKIISPRVYNAVEISLLLAEQKLKRKFSNKAKIGLAMHISALMERIATGEVIYNDEINKIAINNPEEFKAAKLMREVLEEELEINIPKEEIGFITMFLSAVDLDEKSKKIGVIVLAHGDHTASSIADVANSLLDTDHCQSIDMPLHMKVENILEEAIEKVKNVDEGKGVLLLVDMGSLTAFSEIIFKKTNIMTNSIENVSTPLVIEAVRKSFLPEMTLSKLVEELETINPYIGRSITDDIKNKANISKPKVIFTTCITGKGAAIKIAELLENALPFVREYNLKIKPLDITSKTNIKEILRENKDEEIVAVVGTVNLHIPGVPFISMDELIIGDGIKNIERIIGGVDSHYIKKRVSEQNIFVQMLEKILVFLNPIKAYNYVNKSYIETIGILNIDNSEQLKIRYIFHVSCMIERLLQKESLPYKDIDNLIKSKKLMYEGIKNSLVNIEEAFGIKVPDTEIAYIIELLDND